jgi:Concanavalin A-like lectin/glucanases superfamily
MRGKAVSRIRSQSAMEYLMTYGWSIVIIAMVLGALYSLGVFSSANLGPHAPTGNCKVLRVASMANLEGTCSGVPPQSVAQFNGQSSRVNLYQINQESGTNPMSFTVWFYTVSTPVSYPMIFIDTYVGGSGRNGYDLWVGGPGSGAGYQNYLELERFYSGNSNGRHSISALSMNTWYFAAVTYDGNTMNLYLNGALQQSGSGVTGAITPNAIMAIGGASGEYGNYQLSNFQVYNASLDANQISALYLKGIGAAPIDPYHVIGWWPLNGDVNDYSGNSNNGAATAVTFTSSWTSGYTPP